MIRRKPGTACATRSGCSAPTPTAARLQVRFDGIKAGRYGVMVLHDKDGNRKFDIGPLGIPKDD